MNDVERRMDAMAEPKRRSRRALSFLPVAIFVGIAVGVAIGAVAFGAGHYGERTKTLTVQASAPATPITSYPKVSPTVAAGAHAFVQFACVECHGMQGRGG